MIVKTGRKTKCILAAVILTAVMVFAAGCGRNEQTGDPYDYKSSGNPVNITYIDGDTQTAPNTLPADNTSIADVVEVVADSVVEIRVTIFVTGLFQQYVQESAGSGVIISSSDTESFIVTNNHVIEDAQSIEVKLRGGQVYNATLVGTDAPSDLAVIKVEQGSLTAAAFGNSDNVRVGQTAIAIGNPEGVLGGSVTCGIISAKLRQVTVGSYVMGLMQTDASINPGNSGGGLFNLQGHLVGIVNAKSVGDDIEGLGFAIPSNKAVEIIEELTTYRYVRGRADLGVTLGETKVTVRGEQGTYPYVTAVSGTNASAALKVNDIIISVNGNVFSSAAQLNAYILTLEVDSTVEMEIGRSGNIKTVPMLLKEFVPDYLK